jgi:hypothetical protein
MRGTVAVVKEQGQVFSVVAVKDSALNPAERENTLQAAQTQFGPRTASMGERRHQTFGPDDIVRWLSGIDAAQLPWREFTLN